jgi:hypothetical protein
VDPVWRDLAEAAKLSHLPVPKRGSSAPECDTECDTQEGSAKIIREPRCPACGGPVPAAHDGRGRQPAFCGSDRCKQARARRAAERREAAALLRLVAQMAAYGAVQVSDGLAPADARAAIGELAAELDAAAVRLRRMARPGSPGSAERRTVVRLLFAQGMSGTQVAARVGLSERTVYEYRRQDLRARHTAERSPEAR